MKKDLPSITGPNAAWIIHREDVETSQDGHCNIYLLFDAYSSFCFGQEVSIDIPKRGSFASLLKSAFARAGVWPNQILFSKAEPAAEDLKDICDEMGLKSKVLTAKELHPFIKPIADSLREFNRRELHTDMPPTSDTTTEELKAFIPEPYNPCPCGSDKKFKFCCQKIFKNITFAMCAAEEGNLEEALQYMKEAESKVGRTAEVVCRLAIVWSFFDQKKSRKHVDEALNLNPNHPRLNYILGIELVAEEKFDEAITHYLRAIDNYPPEDKFHLNEAYNNLGSAYIALKKYKEAKEVWEKALVLLPSDEMVLRNLVEFIYENPKIPPELREISPFIARFLPK